MTGLDEFKLLLKEFRNLSLWAAGGSVILPFIASFISVIPPFPAGLNIMTAVFQLVALVFVYQKYRGAPAQTITRNIGILFGFLFVTILAYMILFTLFTVYVPPAKRSIVIGYQCTKEALVVYGEKCPFLNVQELGEVAYDEFELWTKMSIAVTRGLLIGVWFLFFIALAALLGKFLVYQMRRTMRGPRSLTV
jgi:hypothetical protein